VISDITPFPRRCAECGDPCDDTWSRISCDITPTDRGDQVRDFEEFFCADCAEILIYDQGDYLKWGYDA
jgi:hypothetical protein